MSQDAFIGRDGLFPLAALLKGTLLIIPRWREFTASKFPCAPVK